MVVHCAPALFSLVQAQLVQIQLLAYNIGNSREFKSCPGKADWVESENPVWEVLMRITLDNNCLISLKNKDGEYVESQALVDLHPDQITVYIPAIAASENQQGTILHTNFAQFQEFLVEIGCEKYELLNPMIYLDISYFDHAIFADEQMESIERKIHEILFPNTPFLYAEYCKCFGLDPNNGVIDRKWRRAKCDVQAMWCHIHYNNDIFVTQDNNFHKTTKKGKLVALGAREILRPRECLSKLKGVIKI